MSTQILSKLFFQSAKKYSQKLCVADSSGKKLSYFKAMVATLVLSRILKFDSDEARVGVLLPPSVAGFLVNIALNLLGKTSINLNYVLGEANLNACVKKSAIKTIISSKAFLNKMSFKFEDCEILYAEDIFQKAKKSILLKMGAALLAKLVPISMIWRIFAHRSSHEDTLATIIFSSGSTGDQRHFIIQ